MKNQKKINFKIVFTVLLLFTTLFACSKDDDDKTVNNSTYDVISIVNNGSWAITYYYDTDHEETTNFVGFSFVFGANGVVTASKDTNNYAGVWSVIDSNSSEDSLSDLDFNLSFMTPDAFVELTDDWEIIEKTPTLLKLKDISGGNGGIDYLTFTKK